MVKGGNHTPATWDDVLEVVNKSGQRGVTNRQIAEPLNTDCMDVSQLTRLLTKAGLITFRRDQITNIYTALLDRGHTVAGDLCKTFRRPA
jgi:DNA-binding MarR family transcriptional regulator